jgi:hypothetical protein
VYILWVLGCAQGRINTFRKIIFPLLLFLFTPLTLVYWCIQTVPSHHLLRNNTYVTGTINPKRTNYSRECANSNLEKGEAAFYKKDDKHQLAVKFRAIQNKANNQPKVVCMLTTGHRALIENSGKKDKDGNDIRKPTCILSYNNQMGGVDMVDQQLHGIQTLRKTYKWYRKLVLRLIMQCALNSHKVYQLHTCDRFPGISCGWLPPHIKPSPQ